MITLPEGAAEWRTVFDQTFVKSLRVKTALRVGLAICFFVNGNDVWSDWMFID